MQGDAIAANGVRVVSNLKTLLEIGTFAGQHSQAVTECRIFVEKLLEQTAAAAAGDNQGESKDDEKVAAANVGAFVGPV